MPSGFYNGEVMFADNVSFDGTQTPGKVTTNGQLLIGSSVAPNIRVGTLTSTDGTVTITNGNGTINLSASGGSAIETINGDTGSITGSTVTIHANVASRNSGSTVRFVNSGTTSTLNLTDGVSNIMLGSQAGNLSLSGIANLGLGQQALTNLVTGNQNTALGNVAMLLLNNSSNNTAIGYASMINTISGQGNTGLGWGSLAGSGTYNFSTAVGMQSMQDATATNNCAFGYVSLQNATGLSNDAFGVQAGQQITSGINNKCFGNGTLARLTTGSNNIGLGDLTGFDYVSNESNNILICNTGITAENNTIRIGNSGSGAKQQNRSFIAGIYNTTVGATNLPLVIDSLGQIGTNSSTNSSTIIIKSGLIDLTVLGDTILFTPLSNFVVNQINSAGTTLSGTIGAPVANFGFTAPNYDESFNGYSFFPTIQGKINGALATLSGELAIVPAGTSFRINVVTADGTATTNSQTIHVMGYYI